MGDLEYKRDTSIHASKQIITADPDFREKVFFLF